MPRSREETRAVSCSECVRVRVNIVVNMAVGQREHVCACVKATSGCVKRVGGKSSAVQSASPGLENLYVRGTLEGNALAVTLLQGHRGVSRPRRAGT